MGSAFLCADLSITPEVRADHADYIGNWLKFLENDKKAVSLPPAWHRRLSTTCTPFSPLKTLRGLFLTAGNRRRFLFPHSLDSIMDPNRCYQYLLEVLEEDKFEVAQSYASLLKDWLASLKAHGQ